MKSTTFGKLPLIALGGYAIIAAGVGFTVVRWVKTAENATDYSIMNTARQSVTSSSWVAMIGPMALPISEIMHWKMPLFMPRRLGCEASTATATPIDATGPSASPITARI